MYVLLSFFPYLYVCTAVLFSLSLCMYCCLVFLIFMYGTAYPSRAHVFRAALVWLPFASTCVQSRSCLVTLREHMCSEPLLFGYPSRALVFRALLFGYPSRAHVFRAALVWLPFASTCVQSRSCLVRSALFMFVYSFLSCVLFALFVSVCVLCARVLNVSRVSKLSIFELIQCLWCSLCMSE
jgi:hypothetical protein